MKERLNTAPSFLPPMSSFPVPAVMKMVLPHTASRAAKAYSYRPHGRTMKA